MRRSILATLITGLFLHSAIADSPQSGVDATLDGFSSQHARTEREWEEKFRALPSAQNSARLYAIIKRSPS